MLSSWLQDLRCEQLLKENFKYSYAPPVFVPDSIKYMNHFRNDVSCDIWQDCSVILPKAIYDSIGDQKILEDQLESMIKYIDSIPREKDSMLWDRSNTQLGDWLDPCAPPDDPAKTLTDPFVVTDAFLYYILDLISTILKILGQNGQFENYNKMRDQCRVDFRKNYTTSILLVM